MSVSYCYLLKIQVTHLKADVGCLFLFSRGGFGASQILVSNTESTDQIALGDLLCIDPSFVHWLSLQRVRP